MRKWLSIYIYLGRGGPTQARCMVETVGVGGVDGRMGGWEDGREGGGRREEERSNKAWLPSFLPPLQAGTSDI